MNLNICLLLFVTATTAVPHRTADEQVKSDQLLAECIKETHVSEDEVKKFYSHNFVEQESHEKIRSFALCYLKKGGWITEAGDLVVAGIRAKVERVITDKSKADEVVERCAVKKETPGETSHELIVCLRRALNPYLNGGE